MKHDNGIFPQNAVQMAHHLCRMKVTRGSTAVDATAGNGNDTAFLADIMEGNGKIYSFDIQGFAIENTKKRMSLIRELPEIEYIVDGHENMLQYVNEEVDFVIFNLGYLPKGNHSIATSAHTTIKALQGSLDILKPRGMVALVVYPGHSEGKIEKEALEEYTANLDQKKYNAIKFCFANQVNMPPYVIAIEKIANAKQRREE